MANYTQEEQVEIVKFARDLTATIEAEEREVQKVSAEVFYDVPQPPVRTVVEIPKPVEIEYPSKPKTDYGFTNFIKEKANEYKKQVTICGIVLGAICCIAIVIMLLISIFMLVKGALFDLISFGTVLLTFIAPFAVMAALVALIVIYTFYLKKRNGIIEQMCKTPEYLELVAEAENAAAQKQAEIDENVRVQQENADREYEESKSHYDNVIIPEYNNALETWKRNKETKIGILEEEISLNKETLTDLYDTTKLISVTYRPLWILSWLYSDMSSSDHDIRYATELLDRDRQRLATEEAGRIVRSAVGHLEETMKIGFCQVYNAIDEGNYLQEEAINELTRVRKSVRNGNLIGTVQRHNTNKRLDSLIQGK